MIESSQPAKLYPAAQHQPSVHVQCHQTVRNTFFEHYSDGKAQDTSACSAKRDSLAASAGFPRLVPVSLWRVPMALEKRIVRGLVGDESKLRSIRILYASQVPSTLDQQPVQAGFGRTESGADDRDV